MANRLSTATMTTTPSITKATGGPRPTHGNVIKSLQMELMTLMQSPTAGISAFPSGVDMTKWGATIEGPIDTPYENLKLKLRLSFPNDYPLSPPEVMFKTPIYHPNVDFSGRICLDILKPGGEGKEGAWSAGLNTSSVLLSIQSLLGEPNNASPLNGEAATLWDSNPAEFKRKVLARHQDLTDENEN